MVENYTRSSAWTEPSAQSMRYHQHMPEAGDCLLAEDDLNVRHGQDQVQGLRR
jgi:hypothetical protein